jgi:hypothetical protein
MLTANFQHGEIVGTVRRANAQLDAFDSALYSQKLYKVYDAQLETMAAAYEVVKDDHGDDFVTMKREAYLNPSIQAATTIYNAIRSFCEIAPSVIEFEGAAIRWSSAKDNPDCVDETFRFWLSDVDLQKVIIDALTALNNPNGVLSGVLTEVEAKDPLSVNSGESTLKVLPKGPRPQPGNAKKSLP